MWETQHNNAGKTPILQEILNMDIISSLPGCRNVQTFGFVYDLEIHQKISVPNYQKLHGVLVERGFSFLSLCHRVVFMVLGRIFSALT